MVTLTLLFASATQTFSLPVGLISALCFVESSHRVDAVHIDDGGSSSQGVCQIKLATARMLGFKGTSQDLMIPKINIYYAAKYLRKQLTRYDGEVPKALAAYNAGKYRVNESGQILNGKYVEKVLSAWKKKR